jgi:hypothetical protein
VLRGGDLFPLGGCGNKPVGVGGLCSFVWACGLLGWPVPVRGGPRARGRFSGASKSLCLCVSASGSCLVGTETQRPQRDRHHPGN